MNTKNNILSFIIFNACATLTTYTMNNSSMILKLKHGSGALINNECTALNKPYSIDSENLHSKKVMVADVSYPGTPWAQKESLSSLSEKMHIHPEKGKQFIAEKNSTDDLASAIVLLSLLSVRITSENSYTVQDKIINYLLADNKDAQDRFRSMSIAKALSHYSASETLSQNPMTQLPVASFFVLSKQGKQLIHDMYRYFNNTKNNIVYITKEQAHEIASWENAIKKEFKNGNESFKAAIMLPLSEKALIAALTMVKGALYGAGIAIGYNGLSNYLTAINTALPQVIAPVIFAITNTVASDTMKYVRPTSTPSLSKIARIIYEIPEELDNTIELSHDVVYNTFEEFQKQVYTDAVLTGVRTAKPLVNNILSNSLNEIVQPNIVNNSQYAAFCGAIANLLFNLRTINEPVQTIKIKKM